jgi:16S rRNA (guanine966-N2)-methyltransferase
VRVIAGAHRGATLRAPRGAHTRPTSDRVREAVFSILGDITDVRVLDLFAGSGALAIEALSRGAASATLVDSGAAAITAINGNLAALGIAADVRRARVPEFLSRARTESRQYDLVFVDPPYRLAGGLGVTLTDAVVPVLAPGARVVAESDRRDPLELELPLLTERRYGDTMIRIHAAR